MDYPFIYPKISIPLFHLTTPYDPLFTVVMFSLMVLNSMSALGARGDVVQIEGEEQLKNKM